MGGVLLIAAGTAYSCARPTPAVSSATPQATATVAAASDLDLAVVDFKGLLKNHPDYQKLQQMDEHIRDMQQETEMIPVRGAKNQQAKLRQTMEDELAKAHAELNAEKAAVESQLQSLSKTLGAQMQAEVNRLQAEANAQVKKKISELAPSAAGPMTPPDTGGQTAKKYWENLNLMRSRALMARKLELEKALSAHVEAERGRLDAQLASYEDQVRGKYQEELVNLNLKLRLAKDDAEQKKLDERNHAIQSEIDKAKAAKRAECDSEFKSFYAGEKAKFDSEYSAYQKKVDSEVRQKAGAPPVEDAHTPARTPSKEPPAQVKAEIAKMQVQMKAELEAKSAQLRARMEGEQRVAVERLKGKQAQIQARLKAVEQRLLATMKDRNLFLDKDTKLKLTNLEKQLTKAKDERKQLYNSMAEDINKAVGSVASKQKVGMVLGEVYYAKPDLPDLTDLSMVSLKQLGSNK